MAGDNRKTPPPRTTNDDTHKWVTFAFVGHESCELCGVIRRRDRQNGPCRGYSPVRLRGSTTDTGGCAA